MTSRLQYLPQTTLAVMAYFLGATGLAQPADLETELLSQSSQSAQVEEEDLAPDTFFANQKASTRALFEEAAGLFNSADQPEALPLLDQVVAHIEQRIEQGLADEAEREMLLQALFYRAEALFNLGDDETSQESLSALLTAQPGYQPDPARISPKLLQLYEELRNQLVGEVRLSLQPPDSVLAVEGQPVEVRDGRVALLAGNYSAQVTRLGYQSREIGVVVIAGSETAVEVELERSSAVAQIYTQPSGVEVFLDGEFAGTTSRQPTAAEDERAEASYARMDVEGLSVGQHLIEVGKKGYRRRRLQLVVRQLRDYAFQPIVLEPMAGTLRLHSIPADARILLNGVEHRADSGSAAQLRLELPPGPHRVTVTRGSAGWFESDFTLADRQTVDLTVRLRPGMSFLGVLGGDELTARDLRARLGDFLSSLDGWAFLDRSATGASTAERVGLNISTLRRSATRGVDKTDLRAWKHLQQEVDATVPGTVYLLVVLSDDLFAREADLWFIPTAPAPALPARLRVDLEASDGLTALLPYFEPRLVFERSSLGIEVIDSMAAERPVVTFVAPGSPAAQAGIRLGEHIVELDGQPVMNAAALTELLASRTPGSRIELRVSAGPAARSVAVTLGTSPSVVSASDPRLLYPLAWAILAAGTDQAAGSSPPWVVRLNQAAVFLRGGAWAEAIQVLRETRAPEGSGLGQAAVDYWLGVALLAADPTAYLARAREAFTRALEAEDNRLSHDLGPLVSLRARGRLAGISTP